MSDETPNVRIRERGSLTEQVGHDQVQKALSGAMAEAARSLIRDAVEEVLDLAYKAHRPEVLDEDRREIFGVDDSEAFREWLKPVREQAAMDVNLSPTVAAYIARYLA